MKNTLILIIKGFFMGIANVIPGVSGGTIALILGIFKDVFLVFLFIILNITIAE